MGVRILNGDCRAVLKTLPAESVHCIVTSPPYFGLRDYGVDGQIGLEATPDDFVAEMVAVFAEARRVLRNDGTLWLNIGDSYAGSGRGGNPEAGTKQGTNRGSQSVGALYGRDDAGRALERPRIKAGNDALFRSGVKPKDMIGVPWAVAFALRAEGWYLRKDIIWHKPNPMPESVTDRPTSSHEHVFLFAKSERYFYDADAIREEGSDQVPWTDNSSAGAKDAQLHRRGLSSSLGKPARKRGLPPRHAPYASSDQSGLDAIGRGFGRNSRDVWTIATQPFSEAHFATFPPALAERCIKAGCPAGGTVLDPFGGAGTTGLVADRLGRSAILIELNPTYADLAMRRIEGDAGMFSRIEVTASRSAPSPTPPACIAGG